MTKPGRLVLAVLLAAALVGAGTARAAPPETAAMPASRQTAAEAGAPATPHPLPESAITRHEVETNGRRIAYTATAGILPLGGDPERPEAHLFYVAYAADRVRAEARPVAFVLNGGPGASAAYLHLGALGPQRVVFQDGESSPSSRVVANPDTWLTFTDLVFIDPIGTGFSRAALAEEGEEDRGRFLGTEADLDALSAFIRLWLSRNERWSSPKFLVGESYGGFRVAALADLLAERQGIQVNGAVLISPVLEFSLHDGDSYTLLPWVLRVPSFAAVAHRHGKGTSAAPASGDLESLLHAAEEFSLAELLPGLAQGDALPAAATAALYRRLASLVGLPADLVRRHSGRIPRGVFATELLRADRRVVSLYDGSLTAIDPDPGRSSSGRDSRLTRLTTTIAAAVNDYLRRDLDYETDLPYRVLNREVSRRWEWREDGQGFIGAADALEAVLSREPAFRVLIAHGVYDLVTPYFTSVYVARQMRLDPELRGAISVEIYEGGHMFYTHDAPRARLASDARVLFEAAAAGDRRADAGADRGAPAHALP
jgi:carboxypeptidase C (cathepsin A)